MLSGPSNIIASALESHAPPFTASYDLTLYQEDIFLQPQPVPAVALAGGDPAKRVSLSLYSPLIVPLSRKIQSMLAFQPPPAGPLELS